MDDYDKKQPWTRLDQYRNDIFKGEWPSLPELFEISCREYPDHKCFECFLPDPVCFTYTEARTLIRRVASHFVGLGIKKGDRIALTGKNSPYWAIGYLAVVYMGAIVVPVDYTLKDEEIQHLIDYVEVKGVLADAERLDRIAPEGRYGFRIALEDLPQVPESNNAFTLPTENDLAAFLFTSGTTGIPKAVMLTHKNFVSDYFMALVYMPCFSTDVFYAILPIHHVYTMLAVFIAGFGSGADIVFGKKLVVGQIFKELKLGHVTMFLAVPLLFNKLIKSMMKNIDSKGWFVSHLIHLMMNLSGLIKKVFHKNPGKKMFNFILKKVYLDTIRICIAGGGPLPPETFRQFNQLGVDFVQGYGLTETSPILTLNPVDDYEETSIGKPLPNVEMKFVNKDEAGNGEICVRGPMVMKGYYNNPEATKDVIDEDGFLHTGDVGCQDEKGFVYITGRCKNIIVTEGGKNVFPEEIEDHFQLYDNVEQICIVGYVADAERKSEGICAIIYPDQKWLAANKDDAQKKLEDLCETVNADLLPYKRIRKVIIADEPMEMTSSKKIKRFAVVQKYKAQLG